MIGIIKIDDAFANLDISFDWTDETIERVKHPVSGLT
jgi:hypothetical protein